MGGRGQHVHRLGPSGHRATGSEPPSSAHLPEGTFSSDATITASRLLGSTPGSPLAFSDASVLHSLRFGWFCFYFWGLGGGEGFEVFMYDFKHSHVRSFQT